MTELHAGSNRGASQNRPGARQPFAESALRNFLWSWWPALLWAVFIFVMSTDAFSAEHTSLFFKPLLHWLFPSMTAAQFKIAHFYIRKSAHFTEYFIFCLFLFRGVRGRLAGWRWSWALAAFFIAAGYSALDEIHQAFVASRGATPYDSLLDSSAALFAVFVLYLYFRFRRNLPASAASSPNAAS